MIFEKKIIDELLTAMDAHVNLAYHLVDKLINETDQPDIEKIKEGQYCHIRNCGYKSADELSDNWKYFVHGEHCKFYNTYTKQEIEISLGNNEWIENLDPFFFHNFISTSEQFESLSQFFQRPFQDMLDLFEKLEEQKLMKHIYNVEYRKIRDTEKSNE